MPRKGLKDLSMSQTIENLAEALHAVEAAKSALRAATNGANQSEAVFIMHLICDAEELQINIRTLLTGKKILSGEDVK